MTWIAISFIVYTLAVMLVGIASARYSQQTSADYFLAGRGLGPWVAALSAAASAESGWVTLGLVGVAYRSGLSVIWLVFGTAAAFLVNWLVLAPRLRQLSADSQALTIPELLSAKCGRPLATTIRGVSASIILVMLTCYVAAQLNAAGKAFLEAFEFSYQAGVVSGATIVLVYTLIGGFRAVAWTDVAQSVLMISAVIILPAVMIEQLGGPASFWSGLCNLPSQQLNSNGTAITLADGASMTSVVGQNTGLAMIGVLAVWLGIPLGNFGQPHILVRLMATRDAEAIRRPAIISTVWVIVLFCGAILVGLTARELYEGGLPDPERALPHAALDLLPAPLAGLMIAAMVAAMCSTADSQLLVSASAVSHDLCGCFTLRHSDRLASWLNRLAVVAIGVFATLVALGEVRVVFDFVLVAWDGLGAAFGPAIAFKLLWKRTSGGGILAGIIVGFATACIWRLTLHAHLYSLIPAFGLSSLAIFVFSYVAPTRSMNEAGNTNGG